MFETASAQYDLRIARKDVAAGLVILIDGLWNSLATDKDGLRLE